MGLLICKYSHQSKISRIILVRACGPLVFTFYFILFCTFSFRSSVYLQFILKPFFDILLFIVFRCHFLMECLYAIYFPRTYTTLHVYIFFRLQFPIMSLLAILPKSIFHQFLLYIVPFTFIFRSSVYFRFSLAALHIHVNFVLFLF